MTDTATGKALGFGEVWDFRHDPEARDRAMRVAEEFGRHVEPRREGLGFVVQPVPGIMEFLGVYTVPVAPMIYVAKRFDTEEPSYVGLSFESARSSLEGAMGSIETWQNGSPIGHETFNEPEGH